MFPTMHRWKRGEVEPQEYYTFRNGLWYPVEAAQGSGSGSCSGSDSETVTPRSLHFAVLSWNIDFMRPQGEARMAAALGHLSSLISAKPRHPSIIMLNEMTQSDLRLIKRAEWVRAGYHMTDVSPDHWEGSYGITSYATHPHPLPKIYKSLPH